ncbi:hypothetical protein [Sphingomonas sp. AX6]|uniref:hypothetical protein n=1 Tax=Sphingomonas sp. AX6 TaxID=2653171 RepID=UPI0012EFEB07|nr:hypothetical protein [Sphingomonas sp. AX6]VXC87362.1 conserved membrane hypothetical protein [Sphingomonas sp. AX6]
MNARLEALQAWTETPAGKWTGRGFRWAFFAGVIGWLVLKVSAIGWREVLGSLPTTPWFYILFVVMFVALPVTETLIFRLLLDRRIGIRDVGVFIRKRVFNSAFVGYSGELYLFVWAKRHLGLPAKRAAHGVKDNAVLSALASAAVTAGLLAAFWMTGQAALVASWLDSGAGKFAATALALAFLLPVLLRFRKSIIAVPGRIAATVWGIHMVRITGVLLLQAVQWWVVLPNQSWTTWLIFLTAQMVISRLPFIPNRDLLFLSAGLEMSNVIDGPRAAMAAVLLAGGALTQGANLLFFIATSFGQRAPAELAEGDGMTSNDDEATESVAKEDGVV